MPGQPGRELSRATARPNGVTSASALAALVVPLLLVSACGTASESTGTGAPTGASRPPAATELEKAQQRWTDVGPVAYRMTLVSSCGERLGLGVFEVTVTPEEAKVQPVDGGSADTDIRTVPDLFTFIDETTVSGAEVVDVQYDVELGYPKQIEVDHWVDAIDDEACYQVKNFESLEAME